MNLVVRSALATLVSFLAMGWGSAQAQPYGLTARSSFPAYLGTMPTNTPTGGTPAPPLLSQTGAFSDTPNMVPHAGLVPFRVNSALWSDAALKTRWVGLPYTADGMANDPTIVFSPTGEWSFPDGTVFVKHFELVINEQTGQKRRLETRIMVRKSGGYVYGRSYRWRPDNSDADVIEQNAPQSLYRETITVTNPDGVTTRTQSWLYPRPNECTQCHTPATGGVLGPRTHQLNGDMLYAATGVTDNQLRTWNNLGMFSAPLVESEIATYLKSVAVTDTSATLENRVRSYLDANCSHCHRPNEVGRYDGRYTTPVLDQEIFGPASGSPNKLRRFNPGTSSIIIRDSLRSSENQGMPPLAKDVVDDFWIDTVTEMVNYPYDVVSLTSGGNATTVRVTFDRAVEPTSATTLANYAFNNGLTVSAAVVDADPKVVVFTTSAMSSGTTYTLTVNRVKESQAPQNPIWPNTTKSFQYIAAPPTGGTLQFAQASYSVNETAGSITIGVTRTGGTGAVSVSYATQNSTATAGADYTATSGMLTWADGDNATKTFMVPVLNDSLVESDEAFTVLLSAPSGGAGIGTQASTSVTIQDRVLDPNADEDGDNIPNGIETQEGRNPYVKDNDVFTSGRLFAMQQYRDFLGREGEPSGIQYYDDQVSGGSVTREQVIESFLAAPEFVNGLPPVIRLYFSFFNRIPDYPGLIFQVGVFRAGTPLEVIAQNFYNSPEFTNTYGALNNDQYINLVYQNVLGRAPDPAGYDYYFTRLESGALTKGQMMIGFSESPEFQQLTDNESWVVGVYVGLLRRTPEQSGLDFYTNLLDGGTPRGSIVPGFFNSPEYRNRFLP